MRKLSLLSILLTLLAMSGSTWTGSASLTALENALPTLQQHPVLQVAEGVLTKVDPEMQRIWIKTQTGEEMEFNYTPQTHVEGAVDTVEGLADRSGIRLRVHFQIVAGSKTAVKIEVLPSDA